MVKWSDTTGSNGQVERYNRLLLQMIRCYIKGRQKSWDKDLQLLASAIRATPNRATGFTANMLFLGRETTSPIDLIMNIVSVHPVASAPAEYVTQLRKTLQDVHEVTRSSLREYQVNQKRVYDSKLKEYHYEPGDLVYKLHSGSKAGEHRKLKRVWMGPVLVTQVLSPALYKVKDKKGEQVLHHDKLKLCEDRHIPMWMQRMRHQFLQLDETLAYEEDEADVTLAAHRFEEAPAVSLQELFTEVVEASESESETEPIEEEYFSADSAHSQESESVTIESSPTDVSGISVREENSSSRIENQLHGQNGTTTSAVASGTTVHEEISSSRAGNHMYTADAVDEEISSSPQHYASIHVPQVTTRAGRRTRKPKWHEHYCS
jgi:hypothetical protein